MPVINITTIINAPIERCFDLARSIDLHMDSTFGTHEKAIAGVTTGLISKGETVTWEARHFGILQQLTTEITELDFPVKFVDVQLKGAFKSIHHQHLFEEKNGKTIMKDVFTFESPGWIFGKLFNYFVLTRYMKNFLLARNELIQQVAESDGWKKYLKN